MKGPDGPFTVPLLATDNKLAVTVGVHELHLTASIERLFVYDLYVGSGKGEVIGWLMEVAKISCTPMEYDAFITSFKCSHPATSISQYSYDLIPMQADDKYGLSLPIPYYECVISPSAEMELMKLFIETTDRLSVQPKIQSWFENYCLNYGYSFKKLKGTEYEELYYAFLIQHGISPRKTRDLALENFEANRYIELTDKEAKTKILKVIAEIVVCIGVAVFCLSMALKAETIDGIFGWGVLFFTVSGFILNFFQNK